MSFESLADFLAMDGYGPYVWGSYLASIIVVLANVVMVRASRRRYLREQHDLERRHGTTASEGVREQ